MAVRHFDLSEPQPARLSALTSAPRSRRDARRLRQRWMIAGVAAVGAPFVATVIVLGVTH
jgi:hypothetical protein